MDESRAEWEEAIQAVVGMWEDEYFEFHGKYLDFPRRMVTPKPVQDPHPPCWMAATTRRQPRRWPGSLGLGLLSFSILQPLDKMAEHIRALPRRGREPDADHPRHHQQGRGVHARALRGHDGAGEANGIWDSVWWWYKNLAEFTLEWEFPNVPEEERDRIFPLLKRQIEGDFDAHEFNDADMIVVGDPERCLEKMVQVRRARCRPADLLRAVRAPVARVDHADHRAARHRGHPRAAQAGRSTRTSRLPAS